MMPEERWATVQNVLDAVLELPAELRSGQIAVMCGEDTELRDEAERLLRACTAAAADDAFLGNAADYASPIIADLKSAGEAFEDTDRVRVRVAAALEGRYRIEADLGSGGMALVFLARDLRHDRHVALKVMKPGLLAGAVAERFLREIRIVAGLTHPHILPLHDSGEAAGLLYHVSAYIEGESLRARLRREGALPVRDALRILRDAASALDYAHRRGIVHRDIKPDNILLQAGHAVVADFGIARAFGRAIQEDQDRDSAATITREGLRLGTPAYMAPEQAAGNAATDHRADLYALGVVGYEMLSGKRPFAEREPDELLAAQLTREPARVERPDVPPALADVVHRLLAKRPADRVQSAQELLDELERIGRDPAARPTSKARGVAAPRRRRVVAAGATVLVIALLLVVGARRGFWLRPGETAAVPLSDKTVVVAAFDAGATEPDTAVDRVLQIAADWLTQGLMETKLVTVVPVGAMAVSDRAGEGGVNRAVSRAARAAGAGLILLPSYYAEGDTIFLSGRILETSDGVLLRSVGPVPAVIRAPMDGVEALRQHVLGALATLVDTRLANWSSAASQPTSFEAYQAFSEGLAAFFDRSAARDPYPLFHRAHDLDTTFTAPLVWALFGHGSINRAAGDSIKEYLQARRSQLAPWDRGVLDFFLSEGDRQGNEEGYQAFRRVVELAPQSEWLYMLAWTAENTNRPAVAVRALEHLDPDRGWMRYWPDYWSVLADAHHFLKQYDQELETARQGLIRFPRAGDLRVMQARALAALGRTTELTNALAEMSYDMGGPVSGNTGGFAALIQELRRHGYAALGQNFADRLLQQLDARSRNNARADFDNARVQLLIAANRWEEAAPMLEKVAKAQPNNWRLISWRAVLAARRGRRDEAERLARQFRELATRQFGPGIASVRIVHNHAAIRAALGEKEKALDLLKSAEADHWAASALHTPPDYDPLYDYPPFIEFANRHYDDPEVFPEAVADARGANPAGRQR